jgi:hypothetical protein
MLLSDDNVWYPLTLDVLTTVRLYGAEHLISWSGSNESFGSHTMNRTEPRQCPPMVAGVVIPRLRLFCSFHTWSKRQQHTTFALTLDPTIERILPIDCHCKHYTCCNLELRIEYLGIPENSTTVQQYSILLFSRFQISNMYGRHDS